jgi:hypothetical protein
MLPILSVKSIVIISNAIISIVLVTLSHPYLQHTLVKGNHPRVGSYSCLEILD